MIAQKKVLIVDDEENLCLLYREDLESEGYLVQTVSDAVEAMKIVEADPPDVVVLDIRMPRMDGIEAMGRILGRRKDMPVILNSAYSSYKDDFRSWPADAYVIKSSDTGELKQTIKRVLGKSALVARMEM
jgi:DNA-binding NtrC family response regulator